MSGIIVGIDGSGHSQAALEWAVREAGVRQAPPTVLTVHEVAASGWGGTVVYQADDAIRDQNRKAGPSPAPRPKRWSRPRATLTCWWSGRGARAASPG